MTSIIDLYNSHYGKFSDKWSLYIHEYNRLFESYRDKPVNLLEIGIQNGGSIEIWSKYFSDAISLVGCDVNKDCARLEYDDPRIKIVIGDVNKEDTKRQILSIAPDIDIIIDDGSHTSKDIIVSFFNYFSALKDDGVYIIEDLHCSYWGEFGGGLYEPFSSIAFFKKLIDVVNSEHWGLDKTTKNYVSGFEDHYCVSISEEVLAHIHSVEFVNSICIITKRRPSSNVLGGRLSAGKQELVVSGHAGLAGEFIEPLNQRLFQNVSPNMSIENYLIEKLKYIDVLENDLANKDLSIRHMALYLESMQNSMSWKLTAPLRFIKQLTKGVIDFLRGIGRKADSE